MNQNNKDLNNILKNGGGINKSTYYNTLTNLTNSTVTLEIPATNYFINGVDIGINTCAYYEDYTTSGSINFSNSPYSGCIKINCLLIGGGGGGGDQGANSSGVDSNDNPYNTYGGSGSGGGSGGCASAQFLNPSGILTFTIGSGSVFRPGNFALSGGNTFFTFQSQTVTANGGGGGQRGSNADSNSDGSTNVAGGVGGSFTNGTTNFSGNNGIQGGTGVPGISTNAPFYGPQDSSDKLINQPWGSIQTLSSNYGKSGVGCLTYNYQPNPKLSIDGSTGSFNGKNGFIRIYYFY